MKFQGYRIPEEKAAIIVDNGYLDRRTITGEIADDRVEVLKELKRRLDNILVDDYFADHVNEHIQIMIEENTK
jgi:hypothetical protein